MKKIGIVSFEDPKRISNHLRLKQLVDIRDHASKNGVTHIVFSGSTLHHYTRNEINIIKDIEYVRKLFINYSVIFEAFLKVDDVSKKTPPYGLYAFEEGRPKAKAICQILVTSRDSKDKYAQLWSEISIKANRIIELNGIRFLVLICGELNILKNAQSNFNMVTGMRYDFKTGININQLNYDILLNPTHKPLNGLFDKYKKRLKYMSLKNKTSILSLNVPSDQIKRSGAMFCYRNQNEILKNKAQWENGWVMNFLDYAK